jgi:hypothetical protein
MVAVEPSLDTPCTKAAVLLDVLDTTDDATELLELLIELLVTTLDTAEL